MVLDLFPGINPTMIKRIAEFDIGESRIKALILKTYGAGNAPDNEIFLDAIEYLINHDVLVVNITQCPQGMVEIGLYEASAKLLDSGVTSGIDMTPEAALCKLMWLFGMGWDSEDVKKQMLLDQRGEQSLNIFDIHYGHGSADPIFNGQQLIPGEVEFDKLESAILRVQGAHFIDKEVGHNAINLAVYTNYQNLQVDTGTSVIQYAGSYEKRIDGDLTKQKSSLFLDITSPVRKFFIKGKPGKLGLIANESRGVTWDKLTLTLYVRV
jgi:L-asparaginase